MNITPHDLAKHLERQSCAFINLVTGDEILLVEESTKLILSKARTNGYEEHIIIEAEIPEIIDLFISHRQNFSLFSTKKIIEIRFRQKISASLAALLIEVCEHPDASQIIILRMPKLSKAETQAKWYKTLEQHGWIITIWPLKNEAFLRWIQARFQKFNLKTTQESYSLIAARTEGNLLAASQLIEKLNLVYNSSSESISYAAIQEALSDQSHYDVFELCDAVLGQNTQQTLKILQALKAQNSEPAIILWALMQDLRKLSTLFSTPPHSRGAVYQKQGIWSTRQPLFQKTLNALNTSILNRLIQKAKNADAVIKGAQTGNIWEILEDFCLIFVLNHDLSD